ncbi:hypothetical protein PQQ51_08860 [Paraburkholderia xenovorans]|uniref:hypothetical protein n=1 Tax=Paraburkholderia xenovorans TaxID=36873 RepID=UPI0038BE09D6
MTADVLPDDFVQTETRIFAAWRSEPSVDDSAKQTIFGQASPPFGRLRRFAHATNTLSRINGNSSEFFNQTVQM